MLNLISTFTHKIPVASILVLVLWVAPANADEKVMDLIIVAGQSNAVGFDAKPSELPDDEVDSNILFWAVVVSLKAYLHTNPLFVEK